jgi:hypothetical protein
MGHGGMGPKAWGMKAWGMRPKRMIVSSVHLFIGGSRDFARIPGALSEIVPEEAIYDERRLSGRRRLSVFSFRN